MASFFARLTNILAPQMAELPYPIPMYFIVGLALSAAFASHFMIVEDSSRKKNE
jgi:hypothetical protein